MASGINVAEDCVQKFDKMKLGKKYRYVIFKIGTDRKTIEIDHAGERDDTFEMFHQRMCEAVADREARYAVIDYEYDAKTKSTKLVFTMLAPDDLAIKEKMLYASSKKALISKLTGIHKEKHCSCIEDLDANEFSQLCASKYD